MLGFVTKYFLTYEQLKGTQFSENILNDLKRAIVKKFQKVQRKWRRSSVFIVNFKHISNLVLVFLLLTLSR